MSGRAHRREPGRLEQEVLAVVAAAAGPQTPAQVQAELAAAAVGQELAYTTVMTTLARLHAKGALARRPEGRGFAYSLAVGSGELAAALTARQMRRLLDAEDDRAGALTRFVADLSAEDEALLAALLREQGLSSAPDRPSSPEPPGTAQSTRRR